MIPSHTPCAQSQHCVYTTVKFLFYSNICLFICFYKFLSYLYLYHLEAAVYANQDTWVEWTPLRIQKKCQWDKQDSHTGLLRYDSTFSNVVPAVILKGSINSHRPCEFGIGTNYFYKVPLLLISIFFRKSYFSFPSFPLPFFSLYLCYFYTE